MPAPYPVSAIANFFIQKSLNERVPLTHLKIQKLLYYAQGWYLANTGQLLFEDNIEAWRYGPVIPPIYQSLKVWGSDPITELIPVNPFHEEIPMVSEEDKQTVHFLNMFWDRYAPYDGIQLANMTHDPGTPWDQVYQKHSGGIPPGTIIPPNVMIEYFGKLI